MPNDVFSDLTQNGFSEQDAAQLIEHGQELELPTRHILCHQGELGSHIYFILEGLCHASYLTEQGKEFSKEFYWEKDWVIGFESVINNQPFPLFARNARCLSFILFTCRNTSPLAFRQAFDLSQAAGKHS